MGFLPGSLEYAPGKTKRLEPGQPPAFGFIGVDGEDFEIAPARMGNVIGAAAC